MKRNFFILMILALAFALVESAVVVYLREIYYPEGFSFPLKLMSEKIYAIELLREISTIIILLIAGIIVGRNFLEKFSYFMYSFATWDIFYYLWLKIFLNWPKSFFAWDILFLIPVPWSGPVITPIIVSAILIFFSFGIVYFSEMGMKIKIKKLDVLYLNLAIFLAFISFIWNTPQLIKQQVPTHFPWILFLLSNVFAFLSFYRIFLS